jgi:hypothetical protein
MAIKKRKRKNNFVIHQVLKKLNYWAPEYETQHDGT